MIILSWTNLQLCPYSLYHLKHAKETTKNQLVFRGLMSNYLKNKTTNSQKIFTFWGLLRDAVSNEHGEFLIISWRPLTRNTFGNASVWATPIANQQKNSQNQVVKSIGRSKQMKKNNRKRDILYIPVFCFFKCRWARHLKKERNIFHGHLDVVNRLLDCKEIEVNVQTKEVSGKGRFRPQLVCPNSRRILFGCGFSWEFLLMIKKNNVGWRDRTDMGFISWTFGCGQSTVGLQRSCSEYAEQGLWKMLILPTSRLPKFSPYSFWMWFLMRIFVDGKKKTCSMERPHWCWLHSRDIWKWPIDCWTSKKSKFVMDLIFHILLIHCMSLLIW